MAPGSAIAYSLALANVDAIILALESDERALRRQLKSIQDKRRRPVPTAIDSASFSPPISGASSRMQPHQGATSTVGPDDLNVHASYAPTTAVKPIRRHSSRRSKTEHPQSMSSHESRDAKAHTHEEVARKPPSGTSSKTRLSQSTSPQETEAASPEMLEPPASELLPVRQFSRRSTRMERLQSMSAEDFEVVDEEMYANVKEISIDDAQAAEQAWQYLHLPDEIILQIIDYVSHGSCAQQALWTCTLISRAWYNGAISLLYRHPQLYGRNFDPFVRAICPSINLHVRKSPLAGLVRVLDMSRLVHQGSKSVMGRLLGRTKERLEVFVAPQATFSLHSFPALSKCLKLRTLDLSLVSESPPLPDLFKAISHLDNLRSLKLPRSTGFGVHQKSSAFNNYWPRNITSLTLSGGIDAHFMHGVASFPSTLRNMTIEHCPLAKSHAVTHLLRTAVRPLEHLETLKIAHMPRISSHALDGVLFMLPQISTLSVSIDYVTPALFDEGHFHHSKDPETPPPTQLGNLRTLELTNSSGSSFVEEKLSPIDLIIAVDDGTLSNLRRVRVAKSLGWHWDCMAGDTEALNDALQEGAKRDWERREWIFRDMPGHDYRKDQCWEKMAGVWVFEG